MCLILVLVAIVIAACAGMPGAPMTAMLQQHGRLYILPTEKDREWLVKVYETSQGKEQDALTDAAPYIPAECQGKAPVSARFVP